MGKITDVKAIRNILREAEAQSRDLLSLAIAKEIVDYFAAQYPNTYVVAVEPLAEWERELLKAPEPTPWEVSKFSHDPIILAKFLDKEDAMAYLSEKVGNTPSNTEFGIKHVH